MKISTRSSTSQTGSKRGSDERQECSEPSSKHRLRVLLFACSPVEAQKALKFGDRMEVAFLPSYDMEEIQREIQRFKPKLVTCSADVFLSACSSSQPAGVTGFRNQQDQAGTPRGVTTAPVTPREIKILSLLAQGKTNNEMASVLRLSARTVKRILSGLCERLGASNRTELSSRAAKLCLLKKDA
jgi:DNA-binding NarL/FixJ family response regulator